MIVVYCFRISYPLFYYEFYSTASVGLLVVDYRNFKEDYIKTLKIYLFNLGVIWDILNKENMKEEKPALYGQDYIKNEIRRLNYS